MYLEKVGQAENFATVDGFSLQIGNNANIYHSSLNLAKSTPWSTPTLFNNSNQAFQKLGLGYTGSTNKAQLRFKTQNFGLFIKGTAAPQGKTLGLGTQLFRTKLGATSKVKPNPF